MLGCRHMKCTGCFCLTLLLVTHSKATDQEEEASTAWEERLSSVEPLRRRAALDQLVSGGSSSIHTIRTLMRSAKSPNVRRLSVRAWIAITGYRPGTPRWAKPMSDLHPEFLLPTAAAHRRSGVQMVLVPPSRDWATRPFFIGKYELTAPEFEHLLRGRSAEGDCGKGCLPIRRVGVKLVEHALSQFGLRLPTNSEWSRAAGQRKATTDYVWCAANTRGGCRPVGQKKANSIGAHDMLGNVWEWCRIGDAYAVCGGGHRNDMAGIRSDRAYRKPPSYVAGDAGFRVAADLVPRPGRDTGSPTGAAESETKQR